ncbi:MAG: hypothetical protein K2V38_05580 [Gemmataceae bacterium]|nr:hypothetical protein [Gemmataceae bacterium]
MFGFRPIYIPRVRVFGKADLPPLSGVITFDDGGTGEVVSTRLRLSPELSEFGARLSEETHRFQGNEAFPFEIRIPFAEPIRDALAVHGAVELWEVEQNEQLLGEVPVEVAEIELLNTVLCDTPWVLDHGGWTTMLAGVQLTHGQHPTLQAQNGFPTPARLVVVGEPLPSGLPQINTWAEYERDFDELRSTDAVVEELKLRIHDTKSGPSAAYPYTGAELNAIFLSRVFVGGVEVVEGVPRELYATVPTFYTPQQVGHFRDVLRQAFELCGIPVPDVKILDESTAGGIGTLQEFVEGVGSHATRLILTSRDGVFRYVSVDIGATSTDFSLVSVRTDEQDGRIIARTQLEAAVGHPIGGLGFTRLVMLLLVARIARQTPALFGRLPAPLQSDIQALAEGQTSGFGDPFLVGETGRVRALLDALAEFVPFYRANELQKSQTTCAVLFDLAEQLKVGLHTAETDGSYPNAVTLGPSAAEQWRALCVYNGVGDAQAALSCSAPVLDTLFAPPLNVLLEVVTGLCRTAPTPVNALCLTGNGSRLRQLQTRDPAANVFLQSLPDRYFDRHPNRVFRAADPKLAVAKSVHAVFKAKAEERDWVWECGEILRLLPYEIGSLDAGGEFEVLIKRGTPLPCECTPRRDPSELTLYRRTYEGEVPSTLGTLTFARPQGKDETFPHLIRVDEERAISNQYGEPITVSPDSGDSSRFRIPLLSELQEGQARHW